MSLDNLAQKKADFFTQGWCQFESDPSLLNWIESALPVAQSLVIDPDNAKWLRCGDTWFAGVNILPNANDGSVGSGSALGGDAVNFIAQALGLSEFDWDKAQVSICYPGYPQRMSIEKEAAFKFRRDRDAAHVDGLLPEGPNRRRFLREWHGFVLAIPLLDYDNDASPFVIWEGSHEVVRGAFESLFLNKKPPSSFLCIISSGPLGQLLDKIVKLFIADSTSTNPGSSHSELKIKQFANFRYS